MARVKIELPETWLYTTEIPVRITDVNYGLHLGNDSFLSIIHDARFRWLHQYGWTELSILDGVGLTMVEVAIRFKAEASFGDVLKVQLAPAHWTELGFDLVYQAVKVPSGEEVARVQSSMVFFDYKTRKIARMPAGFREKAAPGF